MPVHVEPVDVDGGGAWMYQGDVRCQMWVHGQNLWSVLDWMSVDVLVLGSVSWGGSACVCPGVDVHDGNWSKEDGTKRTLKQLHQASSCFILSNTDTPVLW